MIFPTSTIIFSVSVFVFVLIVQALLSRKGSVFGLILPLCWFIFSIYVIIHFKNFIGDHGLEGYMVLGWYGMQIFIGNLPTFILLLIYSMFRPIQKDLEDFEE